MRVELDIPFVENPDYTHCFQACLKMALGYLWPDEKFSFRQLDALSEKEEGCGSWPLAALAWLRRNGLETFYCSPFDYARYAREPFEYLSKTFGKYTAILMRECGDIDRTVHQVRRHLDECGLIAELPIQYDLKAHIQRKHVVICGLSTDVFFGESESRGHSVVVKGFTETGFILHDPGPPGRADIEVPFALFEKAWASPNHRAKELIALYKLPKQDPR